MQEKIGTNNNFFKEQAARTMVSSVLAANEITKNHNLIYLEFPTLMGVEDIDKSINFPYLQIDDIDKRGSLSSLGVTSYEEQSKILNVLDFSQISYKKVLNFLRDTGQPKEGKQINRIFQNLLSAEMTSDKNFYNDCKLIQEKFPAVRQQTEQRNL